MAHALTFVRTTPPIPLDLLRSMIVTGCALALILAGAPLPL